MSKENLSGRKNNTITSDEILGKEVIDKRGKFIGVVESVLMDAKKLEFVGISVDKGFLKKGLVIGKGYIESVKEHAIFLKIEPVKEIKGKEVFDSDGKTVGTVSDIELYGNKNKIKNIVVVPRLRDSFKKIYILDRGIEMIGESVILKVKKSDLYKTQRF